MDLSNDNVIHVKKDGVEYLQFRRLLEYENVAHAYALKPTDVRMHQDNNVYEQYGKILNACGMELNTLLRPTQTHTDTIFVIEDKKNQDEPDIYMDYLENVDGTITKKENITLASTNADCILIIFYDPVKKVIANVHSGWRGTFKKISKKIVNMMKEECGCNPADIIACICPSIRMCHFEVHDDVQSECEEVFKYTGRLDEIIKLGEIKEDKQKYFIDLILITKILLGEEGLLPENIIDSGICSVCNHEHINSRRGDGGDFGLGCAIIGMHSGDVR